MIRFEEEGWSVSVELREVSCSSHEEELHERQEGSFCMISEKSGERSKDESIPLAGSTLDVQLAFAGP